MKKNITGNTITFGFKDNVAPLTFDCAVLSATCAAYAIPFGMGHRLGDNAAGCKTEQERRDAIAELAAHYETGTADWNTRVGAGPKRHAHIEALAAKWGVTYEEAMAKLADLTGL